MAHSTPIAPKRSKTHFRDEQPVVAASAVKAERDAEEVQSSLDQHDVSRN